MCIVYECNQPTNKTYYIDTLIYKIHSFIRSYFAAVNNEYLFFFGFLVAIKYIN